MTTQAFPKPKRIKKKHINLLYKQESRSAIIKKLDKIVSDRIRARDKWTCQRCHKVYTPPTASLQCSHFYSRRYIGTRWDELNLIALCAGCHMLLENEKMPNAQYCVMMEKRIGKDEMARLYRKAYAVTKFSVSDLKLMLSLYEKEML